MEFFALGTLVSVTTYGADRDLASAASRAIERHLNARAVDWYAYADGELASVNAAMRHAEAIDISPPLADLLRRAGRIQKHSGDTFHAGLGDLIRLWGLHDLNTEISAPPNTESLQALLKTLDSPSNLQWQNNRLQPANLQFDLGGIAKGALLEECSRLLAGFGIDDAILNLGGDLLVIGQPTGREAHIGIRSPFGNEAIGGLRVAAGEAVMTSGNYERFRDIAGIRYTHILNPLNGRPVAHTASATVVHHDPVLADAAATALLVGGASRFDQLVRDLEIDVAMLVTQSGDVRLTKGMRQRLNLSLELSR